MRWEVMKVIYVMSDIHGCFSKYQAMLHEIGFASCDTIYILGDMIDCGPDGIQILQDMMYRRNVLPILGNHEFTAAVCLPWLLEEVTDQSIAALDESRIAAYSEWIANGGEATIRSIKGLEQDDRKDILDYLRDMEIFAQVETSGRNFVLTHSGLGRFSQTQALASYDLGDFLFNRPDLSTSYYSDKLLIFGHTPTQILGGRGRIFRQETWIDIDCGCVYAGGQLGCLCLDTLEEFYV